MKILFFGDIFGKPGRKAIKDFLPDFRKSNGVDLCIGNCENLTDGRGVSEATINEMVEVGIQIFSSGNHIYDRKESLDFFKIDKRIARPLNFPKEAPGNSYIIHEIKNTKILLVTLCGQSFMNPLDSPFFALDNLLKSLENPPKCTIVDFHAESTAEKKTFGYYFAGRITAMLGTHTHIQTADEQILAGGTGYITDVGMCGGHDSVIGVKKEISFTRVNTGMPVKHEVSEEGLQINAVLLDIDEFAGKTQKIERIQVKL
ncbi:MAG: TIGR00282 family metallophosphoesterase [Candidatus Cloacimonetes bacterium]|nr:TIGR00282 family metallophosphoesterase [Candidatus Cloacimonadota bacterium]